MDLGPDKRHFYRTLERLSGELHGVGQDLFLLAEEFTEAAKSGNPRSMITFFAQALSERDWSWPWLEAWKERFAREGITPYMWARQDRDTRIPLNLELISHVALRLINDARRWEDMCRLLGRRGWRQVDPFPEEFRHFCGWRLSVVPGDPEKILYEEFDRFLAGDHGHRPPYYPGDRSIIIIKSRKIKTDAIHMHLIAPISVGLDFQLRKLTSTAKFKQHA